MVFGAEAAGDLRCDSIRCAHWEVYPCSSNEHAQYGSKRRLEKTESYALTHKDHADYQEV